VNPARRWRKLATVVYNTYMTEPLYTTTQAAAYLGITMGSLRVALREGRLQPDIGSPRLFLFTRATLDAFAAQPHKGPGRPKRAPAPEPKRGRGRPRKARKAAPDSAATAGRSAAAEAPGSR
jgi:hypothetical protein